MSRTQEQFNEAYNRAARLVKWHNKSFWIIPTETGYAVSCFNEDSNLPEGTTTLEVTPEEIINLILRAVIQECTEELNKEQQSEVV